MWGAKNEPRITYSMTNVWRLWSSFRWYPTKRALPAYAWQIGPFWQDSLDLKLPSYQYWKSCCGDKTAVRSSYLHTGISYTGKTVSLCWNVSAGFALEFVLEVLKLNCSLHYVKLSRAMRATWVDHFLNNEIYCYPLSKKRCGPPVVTP